ncbi:1-acyl-sn-glycerol-3-phosphate acyltransferase [Aldersonia sp. NBC_00410]|uniref:lysophospholipid acyltransferase family protein n=1 Tax=Aldersonia sp. NBC_00410 TaxID=2975954 RepID=UPI0022527359|nr:1-acyl-sn-glycerol-3-phosphate acyltransferase [Aldersonia sp. NBC_00410]MCX5043007.1 1-acyl-sn-glycerol-3-phosphate acyltransferase [Aldersonia sp. NBC_00410]
MPAPEVRLENSDAVYEYYLRHRQNRLQAMGAYALLGRRFHPRVTYADGAKEQLKRLVVAGRRLVISVNHLSEQDPYTLAAAAWRSPLRPIIGRVRVLAKDELFLDAKQRKRVEMMGAIPVFRGKNHGVRAVATAGQQMMDVCATRMAHGDDLAIFPEGTCNYEDVTQVQPVGSGIGHIVFRARKLGVEPALVFVGLSYGPRGDQVKSASYYFGAPVTDIPTKPAEITRLVRAHMQDALTGAVARY